MINKIKNILGQVADKKSINRLQAEVLLTKINTGRILGELNLIHKLSMILTDIQKSEFKVFSQWGDDGIINFLINYLDIPNKTFVEFGVENYTECNTRFLLMNDNWSGLVIDGSMENINSVRKDEIYWRYDLTAINSFVTAENINNLLLENEFDGELGLLHIDIDGNDYWVWKAIKIVNPIIVIVEYNSIFGFDKPWTVPYDSAFIRAKAHYSNLFYGTSLLSIFDLANEKGYSFIGCNSNGNNAYFVRNDKLGDLKVKTAEEGYVLSKFSESRDKDGSLSFLKKNKRLELLKGLKVYNTRKNIIEEI